MANFDKPQFLADFDTSFKVDESAFYGAISKDLRQQIDAQNIITNIQIAEPLLSNTFSKANETFGVLNQADPIRGHYLNAFANIESLRRLATESAAKPSLADRILAYLKQHMSNDEFSELTQTLDIEKDQAANKPFKFTRDIPKITGKIFVDRYLNDPSISETDPSAYDKVEVKQNAHSALFATAEVLTDDIGKMETLRNALIKVRRKQQRELKLKISQQKKLETTAIEARKKLDNLNNTRIDRLDDYALSQRLLADHWRDVEAQHLERQRILENHKGLYYVKVRETPLSDTLPDPLSLRHRSAGDIVPGCSGEMVTLSDELQPFIDMVLDIPAADWRALNQYRRFMPDRLLLLRMVNDRKQRLQHKLQTAQSTGVQLAPQLMSLVRHHQGMLQQIAALPFTASSLTEAQTQAQHIVSLEELLACPVPVIRRQAEQLHNHLHAAAHCFLNGLRELKPSIRLDWAQLAEDDRLALQRPLEWPGLEDAEAEDFNTIRNLVEMVEWWFERLDDNPAATSLTSMRNLLRACLLLAAGDNPQQLLHGRLKTLPGRLRVGEVLRLSLNREPRPGALLNLLDDDQKLIGLLRVDDHDSEGTVASFVDVLDSSAVLTTAMQVYGRNES